MSDLKLDLDIVVRAEDELETLREARGALLSLREELTEANNRINGQDNEIRRLRTEVEVKTIDLRRLQDERNPARIEARIAVEREHATARLQAELAAANATISTLQSEITRLINAKRKLRDALERAKGNRA